MKKIYLSLFAVASLAHGEFITDTELSGNIWLGESSNSFQATGGDEIELENMGSIEGVNFSLAVDAKTVRKLPNIKFQYTSIGNGDTTHLSRDLNYNEVNFDKNQKVETTYEADIVDLIFYSDIKKDLKGFDIDLGGGLRYIDSSLEVKECSKEAKASFDQIVPTLYAKAEYPVKKVIPALEVIYSPIDKQHLDVKLSLGYDFTKSLGVDLGYRFNQIEPDVDDLKSDVVTDGLYLGVDYNF